MVVAVAWRSNMSVGSVRILCRLQLSAQASCSTIHVERCAVSNATHARHAKRKCVPKTSLQTENPVMHVFAARRTTSVGHAKTHVRAQTLMQIYWTTLFFTKEPQCVWSAFLVVIPQRTRPSTPVSSAETWATRSLQRQTWTIGKDVGVKANSDARIVKNANKKSTTN